jgi:1-acyl-sn-glycerol-3-phosphate acyltransferase
MTPYFNDDTYTTPDDSQRFIADRLPLGPFVLYGKFALVVLRARKLAVNGVYDDEQWAKSSYDCLKAVEGCGGRFHISGFEIVKDLNRPVVFIANHMSTMETVVLPVLIVQFQKVTFVVKEKLVHGPAFGPVMRSRTPVTVGRVDPREDLKAVLTGGKKLLDEGTSVIIFPQSTRREVFRRRQFNSLGIKLAIHAGVDVVPVALKTDFWSNGKRHTGFGPINRKFPIHISFGEPLTPAGRGKNEHLKVCEYIEAHLRLWGAPIEETGGTG